MRERIRTNTPSPGTEAHVRRFIASLEAGKPDYSDMEPWLAAAARKDEPVFLATIGQFGTFKTLAFRGPASDGWDVYEATFEHGKLEIRVTPFSSDGKVEGQFWRQLP